MIRQGPWKLYKYHDDTPPALFNLADDPGEWNDLGSDGAYADRAAKFARPTLRRLGSRASGPAQRGTDAGYAQVLTAWGRAVQPLHEDTLPVEDAEDVVRC